VCEHHEFDRSSKEQFPDVKCPLCDGFSSSYTAICTRIVQKAEIKEVNEERILSFTLCFLLLCGSEDLSDHFKE